MGEVLNLISDKCNNRLTSLFQKVIAATEGERGRRPVRFTRKKLMIEGFQFKEKGATSLKMINQLKKRGDEIEVVCKSNFYLKSCLPVKSNATHARFFVVAINVGDLIFNEELGQYEPGNKEWFGKSKVHWSDYIEVERKRRRILL